MTNRHHQSKAEQINKRATAKALVHQKNALREGYNADSLEKRQDAEDMDKRIDRFQEYFINKDNKF